MTFDLAIVSSRIEWQNVKGNAAAIRRGTNQTAPCRSRSPPGSAARFALGLSIVYGLKRACLFVGALRSRRRPLSLPGAGPASQAWEARKDRCLRDAYLDVGSAGTEFTARHVHSQAVRASSPIITSGPKHLKRGGRRGAEDAEGRAGNRRRIRGVGNNLCGSKRESPSTVSTRRA